MANMYNCRPSKLLDIQDTYTAYCLDEACALIKIKIDQGESPKFVKKYSSFSNIYSDLQKGGVTVCP